MIWIWISIKIDGRFSTIHTHVSVKIITDTIISSRIKLTFFRHNDPFVIIDCSGQNESIKSATMNERIKFDWKENVHMNITAYCLIIHDHVVQYNPLINSLCAKLPKCDTTFFPEDNIKIYDASKSTAVFSRITIMSVLIFVNLRFPHWKTSSWRNLLLSKMDSNFLTIFGWPNRGEISPKREDIRQCGWLRIAVEYNGMFHTAKV